eukprot:11264796-Ditylum_brightwellii.AAC.1
MHGRANRRQILHITTDKGAKNILTHFMLLVNGDLKGARLNHTPEEATVAKNMYVALWKLFYTGTVESTICTYQLNPNNLPEKLKELGFNIDKFCNYTLETIKTLSDAGDNDSQASLKLYKVLVSSKIDAFNSETRAYKEAVAAKDKSLDFTKLKTI